MSKNINEGFVEIANAKTMDEAAPNKGRKLSAKDSTFSLDDGEYNGTITDAFWYKTAEERDRVMLVFELTDGTEFKNSVDGDWIDKYPFSKLISQGNIEYVGDFIGKQVVFTIKNCRSRDIVFSNIHKIALMTE